MSEPGCLEPGFVFLRRTGAPGVKSCAWPAILIRVDAELRDAKRNPLQARKLPRPSMRGHFSSQCCLLPRNWWQTPPRAAAADSRPAPRRRCGSRVTGEMSREKSGDFAKNRPELSAIKSVDCIDVDRSARDLQKRCERNASQLPTIRGHARSGTGHVPSLL